jgi:hypothetical protein
VFVLSVIVPDCNGRHIEAISLIITISYTPLVSPRFSAHHQGVASRYDTPSHCPAWRPDTDRILSEVVNINLNVDAGAYLSALRHLRA